ncbi:hypothetical protein ACIRJS_32890 [Streptomyces sp. NPDC102340]|uniref:hypothetical protein n=1 Tax=unclassified Streptomyces TaxID=2593676 RepID=UPI0037F33AD6
MDLDDDATAEDPPAVPLPVLTLEEAHELMGLLADVRDGHEPDAELARYLLGNLAARVPSLP